jgi:hypothetical protein
MSRSSSASPSTQACHSSRRSSEGCFVHSCSRRRSGEGHPLAVRDWFSSHHHKQPPVQHCSWQLLSSVPSAAATWCPTGLPLSPLPPTTLPHQALLGLQRTDHLCLRLFLLSCWCPIPPLSPGCGHRGRLHLWFAVSSSDLVSQWLRGGGLLPFLPSPQAHLYLQHTQPSLCSPPTPASSPCWCRIPFSPPAGGGDRGGLHFLCRQQQRPGVQVAGGE